MGISAVAFAGLILIIVAALGLIAFVVVVGGIAGLIAADRATDRALSVVTYTLENPGKVAKWLLIALLAGVVLIVIAASA